VLTLLRAAERFHIGRFLQVSTDEVYGARGRDHPADEQAPLRPGNYYAASKAAADLYISAALNTRPIDAVIIRGTNNFGPHQYPEKAIPFFTGRVVRGETLPLYGDGLQMRDWLFVDDFCHAIWLVFTKGTRGRIYNAGAGNHLTNLDLSRKLVAVLGADPALIHHVADRPGHDTCYAMDSSKLHALGWKPQADFDTRLAATVIWYRDHQTWVETILKKSPANQADGEFFENHYRDRV
jgi:dTDP-glucose 4,6-dehydratase